MVTDGSARNDITVGIDHRAVKIVLELQQRQQTTKRTDKYAQMRGWTPQDKAECQRKVDER